MLDNDHHLHHSIHTHPQMHNFGELSDDPSGLDIAAVAAVQAQHDISILDPHHLHPSTSHFDPSEILHYAHMGMNSQGMHSQYAHLHPAAGMKTRIWDAINEDHGQVTYFNHKIKTFHQ